MNLTFLLLAACALTVSGAGAFVPQSQHQVVCSRLKPVSSLEPKKLEGAWLTVETLLLKNGYPEAQQSSRSDVCIRTVVSEASDSGLSMRSEVQVGDKRRRTGVSRLAIDDPLQPGLWTLTAKRPSTLNAHMMALGVRASEFLVLAFCQPPPLDDMEFEERPALWVKVLSRPSAYGGGVAASNRELHSLRNKIKEMLGLTEFNSVRYDTAC